MPSISSITFTNIPKSTMFTIDDSIVSPTLYLLVISFQGFSLHCFNPKLILLFIGFKDDMLGLSPKAKLLTEIGTATIFIVLSDCRLDSFYGLFGIYEINYYLSIT